MRVKIPQVTFTCFLIGIGMGIGLLGISWPVAAEDLLKISQDQWQVSAGGQLRLRYERWRDGDLVPNSRALNGPAASAWRKGYDDDYLLTNVKIHLDASFDDKFSGYIEGEFADLDSSTKIDGNRYYDSKLHLQQFYLKYSGGEHRVKIGRQTLDYGSRLVLGTNTWINNTISYDVIRYDHIGDDDQFSAFGGIQAIESHDQDEEPDNMVGGYHYAFSLSNWQFEQYTFFKDYAWDDEVYSIGVRVKKPWERFEIDTDFIRQLGDRDAFATHGVFSWFPAPGHWSETRLYTSINVASGDRRPEYNYTPFAPAGHLDRQSSDFSPYINLKEYGFGITALPIKDIPLFVRATWFDMYKYDRAGGIYVFDADGLVWNNQTKSNHLGQQLSLFAAYRIEKTQTEISTCWNIYFIEDAIGEFPNRDDNSFFYLSVTQLF